MQEELARLRWGCRRGMLELDKLLQPFVENQYLNLSQELQQTFQQLLRCEDTELFDWFLGYQPAPAEFSKIIAAILDYAKITR